MQVTLRTRNQSPELIFDGERPSPGFGRLMQPNYWALEKLDQYERPRYNLFFVQIGEMESSGWNWDGEDGYDYRDYDAHLERILAKRPDARLNLFLGGRVPYLWQVTHRDDLVRREDGTVTNLASPTSPAWIRDSTEAVRRFVDHFESSPYADSIAGYNPIYVSNEWLLGGIMCDHSETCRQRFASWTRERYQNDVDQLRNHWKQKTITFDHITVPSQCDFEAHGLTGVFDRHEHFGEYAADYLRFANEGVARLVLSHAATIKKACDRRKFVSVMFGYSYCYPHVQPSPPQSGHWDLSTVLESLDVDLLHSPYDYFNRCLGGPHYSQLPADTVLAHGKVFATQIDTKTHVHRMARGNAATPWESEQILKRDVSYVMMRNAYHYYYEMCEPAWRGRTGTIEYRPIEYMDERVQDTIVRLRDLSEDNHVRLPDATAEVAWFSSRAGAYTRAFDKRYNGLFVQATRQYFLPYTSAPVHDYILEDFDRVERDYKVYIFPDATFVDVEQRRRIRERLERLGATAVWSYAPGFFDEKGGGLDRVEQLTGIRLARRDLRDYLHVDINRFDHPLTQGLENEADFGSNIPFDYFQSRQEWLRWMLEHDDDYKFSPLFTVDDPDATTLGTLRGAREPGLAVKRVGEMTSIYSSAPCLPSKLLSNIFSAAGVHRYTDSADLVYANSRYLTICVESGGDKLVSFPSEVDLYDAMTDRRLAERTSAYRHPMRDKQVDIFRLEASI
jgi:hypothetical protein